jgi:hypothetical protein
VFGNINSINYTKNSFSNIQRYDETQTSPTMSKYPPVNFRGDVDLSAYEVSKLFKQKYNIESDFGGNSKLANFVMTAFDNIDKNFASLKNARLKIVYDYSIFENIKKGVNPDGSVKELCPAVMDSKETKDGTLFLNPKFDWVNIEERIKNNFTKGNLAYDKPEGLIYHELAHYFHAKSDWGGYKSACKQTPFLHEKIIMESEVSKLAASDFGEFVAEVFAAKMLGKEFSENIKNIYNKFAYYGPKIFQPKVRFI